MDLTKLNGGKPMEIEPIEEKSYGPLEEGRYNLECVKVDECQDASGEKVWDELEFNVLNHNRKVWMRLNWQGFREGAYEIADNFRKRAQAALNKQVMSSTQELVGEILSAELEIKEYNGKRKNEVIVNSVKAVEQEETKEAPKQSDNDKDASDENIPF